MSDIFPNLSKSIFKYGPTCNLERTLKNKTLGFSKLSSFNDIYETDYRLTHFFNSRDDAEKLLAPIKNPINIVRELVDAALAKYRVTCFSRKSNIALMWSHYANNHNGVCYVFNEVDPSDLFPKTNLGGGNIVYSNFLHEIKLFQEFTTQGMLEMLATDVILAKPKEWAYEEEYRVFGRDLDLAVEYNPKHLKAIIIGRRVSDEDVKNIRAALASFNEKNKTESKIWFTHRIASTVNLGVTNDFGFRNSSETAINDRIPQLLDPRPNIVTTINPKT